jgi:hypothetical protein
MHVKPSKPCGELKNGLFVIALVDASAVGRS